MPASQCKIAIEKSEWWTHRMPTVCRYERVSFVFAELFPEYSDFLLFKQRVDESEAQQMARRQLTSTLSDAVMLRCWKWLTIVYHDFHLVIIRLFQFTLDSLFHSYFSSIRPSEVPSIGPKQIFKKVTLYLGGSKSTSPWLQSLRWRLNEDKSVNACIYIGGGAPWSLENDLPTV